MGIKLRKGTVRKEFEQYGKSNPALIQTLNKLSELGARINTEVAHITATLAYTQKVKGTMTEKVQAYERILESLLTATDDLSEHGICLTSLLMFLIANGEDIYDKYDKTQPFDKYLCGLQVQKHLNNEDNND